MKVLGIDNGGEFCKKEFEEFYNKCGIERQKTNPCKRKKKWNCRKDE